MTRKFLEAVANGELTEEIKEMAAEELIKLEQANETRRKKAAEKARERQAEEQPMIEALKQALESGEAKTAPMLLEETGLEITTAKVARLMKPFVDNEEITKTKVNKLVAYQLARK